MEEDLDEAPLFPPKSSSVSAPDTSAQASSCLGSLRTFGSPSMGGFEEE